jgi:hypothetical protein
MPLWALLIVQIGLNYLSSILSGRKVKRETEIELPQTDPTAPIAVPFGTCLIEGAQLLDYFDFRSEKIKSSGLLAALTGGLVGYLLRPTTGYRYYLGMVFGVCYGKTPQGLEGAKLTEVLIDNRVAWSGVAFANGATTPVEINKPSFFGAEKQEGGVRVLGYWYIGEDYPASPQDPNDYWEDQRGLEMPNYKDMAYFVWHGPSSGLTVSGQTSGYIGNAARLWPISFKVRRQPILVSNGVIGRCGDTPEEGSGIHANPIECLYECLTNTDWGMGIDESQIDGAGSFAGAASTCWGEGLGFSYLWNTTSPVEEMVAELQRYVNGTIWTDLQTGLIKVKLARADYTVGDLATFTNDDFLAIESFTRGSWEDTKNTLRVTFTDQTKPDFGDSTAYWQDLANVQAMGVTEAAEVQYRGCPSIGLANKLAARDGRVLATPLAKLTVKADRKTWLYYPGSLFKFTWTEQGITDMVLRVANIKFGTILDGTITINAIEDVFAAGTATYGDPDPTVWTDPLAGEAADATGAVGEMPYLLAGNDVPKVFGVAARPDSTHVAYDGALDAEIEFLDAEFAATGTLQNTYPQVSVGDFDSGSTLIIESLVDEDNVEAGTTTTIPTQGASLAILGDPATAAHEWIAFQNVTDNGSTLTLNNVWRGLMDTPPLAHAPFTRIWFFAVGAAIFGKPLGSSQSVTFEALTRTMRDQLTSSEATDRSYTTQQRAYRPLPPYYVLLGGSYTNEQQDSGDVVFTWREHSRLVVTQVHKQSATTEASESGVTWEIDLYKTDGTTLLRSVTGLSSPTYTYTNVDELADSGEATLQTRLVAKFYSKRDGLRSLYPWIRYTYREVSPSSFGNGDWILPSQVFDFPRAADSVAGFDELGVEVCS